MKDGKRHLSKFLNSEEFEQFSLCWKNEQPYMATGNRSRVQKYFAMKDFDGLVNQTGIWSPDRLEVVLDTKKVPPPNFYAQLPLQNGVRYQLQTDRLQKLLDMGGSIVLNNIETMTPGLKTLKVAISDFTGGKVECNLYYSQPAHQAFYVHLDVHDVYAFQISGTKRWQIYQQRYRYPINHLAFLGGDVAEHERHKGAVTMDITMRQGDFLYIPAGYYHQAICTEESSVHVSYSSVEMIGLDVISQLFDRAVHNEAFRAPLTRGPDGTRRPVSDGLKVLSREIGAMLANGDFAKAIENIQGGFARTGPDVSIDSKPAGERVRRAS